MSVLVQIVVLGLILALIGGLLPPWRVLALVLAIGVSIPVLVAILRSVATAANPGGLMLALGALGLVLFPLFLWQRRRRPVSLERRQETSRKRRMED